MTGPGLGGWLRLDLVTRNLASGLARYFPPGHAASHAYRLLSDDIRTRARLLVSDLDEDPALCGGSCQREATGKLVAMQDKRQVPRFVAHDLRGSLIPDNHSAGATYLATMNTLEFPC
jgi:hypothetical protein